MVKLNPKERLGSIGGVDPEARGHFEEAHPEAKGGITGLMKNGYVLWTAVFASLGGFLCMPRFNPMISL